VQLADGETVPAEMVIVGIGIIPAVAPLLDAGANGGNGVAVDDQCRTNAARCLRGRRLRAPRQSLSPMARLIRLESVQNANDQATVAKTILGDPMRL
jgi:3-phenylpropionate/trans-cinnamate dioxygenase ferredoxin reductase subunit